jgi:Calcineurin-like phosphoesterase.
MSTYVMSDLHGCKSDFDKMLAQIQYRKEYDTLWIDGDLCDRGTESIPLMQEIMPKISKNWKTQFFKILTVLDSLQIHWIFSVLFSTEMTIWLDSYKIFLQGEPMLTKTISSLSRKRILISLAIFVAIPLSAQLLNHWVNEYAISLMFTMRIQSDKEKIEIPGIILCPMQKRYLYAQLLVLKTCFHQPLGILHRR